MIIKHRVFKAEKMSDFLAQKNAHEPPIIKFSYTPQRNKFDIRESEDSVFIPNENTLKKVTPITSSNRIYKSTQVLKPSPSREFLPLVEEVLPFRVPEKKPLGRIPSHSTPKYESKYNLLSVKFPPKKPQLFNEKHIDVEPPEDNRRKHIDRAQLKAFNEKYKLEFVTGYHNMNVFNRCLELLNSEHDPFILENIVPNRYTEFILKADDGQQKVNSSRIRNNNIDFQNSLSKKSVRESSFASYLPEIKGKQSQGGSFLRSRESIASTKNPSLSENTNSTSFSLNTKLPLPKLDIETFQNALDYFKNPEQNGAFIFIKTVNKGFVGEFGFCEIVWNDKKKNVACMTKFLIPRAYRKMRLVLPITLNLIEHIFKVLKLEKLVIKLLVGNTFAQSDLKILGFKLEKIEFEDNKKFKLFSMRRVDYEDLICELGQK